MAQTARFVYFHFLFTSIYFIHLFILLILFILFALFVLFVLFESDTQLQPYTTFYKNTAKGRDKQKKLTKYYTMSKEDLTEKNKSYTDNKTN